MAELLLEVGRFRAVRIRSWRLSLCCSFPRGVCWCMMLGMSGTMAYVSCPKGIDEHRLGLKQEPCPFCGLVGFLIGHGYLLGSGPDGEGEAVRGGRVLCSNRNRRGGCGRTFSVMLSWVLRHSPVSAQQVWRFLRNTATSQSCSEAWRRSRNPFTMSTAYRFWKRWLRNQVRLRSLLFGLSGSEPAGAQGDSLAATLEHLERAFASADCPISAFQERFQNPFFN